HDAEAAQCAHQLAIDRGRETEVELLKRLDVRKTTQAQTPSHPFDPPPLPLGAERLGQKLPVIEFALGRLLAQGVELGGQMVELQFAAQVIQLHRPSSS